LATKIDYAYLKSADLNEAPTSLTDKTKEFVLASVLIITFYDFYVIEKVFLDKWPYLKLISGI